MSKVYVSPTKKTGKGLFAKSNIKNEEVIFIVKGTTQHCPYNSEFYMEGPNWLATAKNTWLSPFDNNPWKFINHSCNPNAGLRGKVTVIAMKKINKNEQITIDYSITESDPYWKMKCYCGKRNCRKIIKSIKFLPKRLFQKYRNYIPSFLKKEYLHSSK